jgi:dUTP pyrophosphatase
VSPVKLKIHKLSTTAVTPSYATDGSACLDIAADETCVVEPRRSRKVRTGLAFEYEPGYVLKVFSRSGMGAKNNIRLANGTGIIDQDYRGELFVVLFNDSYTPYPVRQGDRIAQAMLVPLPRIELELVSELGDTTRGVGGFGHTGIGS